MLPLWVAWPRRFDALALALGSMLPDLVDAAIELPTGRLEQNFAHSLPGLATLVLPLGFAILTLTDHLAGRLLPRIQPWARSGVAFALVRRLTAPQPSSARAIASLTIGALSHLLFDGLTHRRLDWFRPWMSPELLPERLARRGFTLALPLVDERLRVELFPLLWAFASVVGAVLFVWCWRVARRRPGWR